MIKSFPYIGISRNNNTQESWRFLASQTSKKCWQSCRSLRWRHPGQRTRFALLCRMGDWSSSLHWSNSGPSRTMASKMKLRLGQVTYHHRHESSNQCNRLKGSQCYDLWCQPCFLQPPSKTIVVVRCRTMSSWTHLDPYHVSLLPYWILWSCRVIFLLNFPFHFIFQDSDELPGRAGSRPQCTIQSSRCQAWRAQHRGQRGGVRGGPWEETPLCWEEHEPLWWVVDWRQAPQLNWSKCFLYIFYG